MIQVVYPAGFTWFVQVAPACRQNPETCLAMITKEGWGSLADRNRCVAVVIFVEDAILDAAGGFSGDVPYGPWCIVEGQMIFQFREPIVIG